MTFRLRLALAAALAVTVAVAIASSVVYVVMRNELRSSVDKQLVQQYQQVLSSGYLRHAFGTHDFRRTAAGGRVATATYVQIVLPDGTRVIPSNELEKVPISKTTLAVATRQERGRSSRRTVGTKGSRGSTPCRSSGSTADGRGSPSAARSRHRRHRPHAPPARS